MDNRLNDYKDLIVWQRAMALVRAAYQVIGLLPKAESFALVDQIRRSAISIPSNIAEGYGRGSTKEYTRFLTIARGSCYELETQLLLCEQLDYVTQAQIDAALLLNREIVKMLTVIITKLGN